MNSFHRINFSICVRKKSHIKSLFVNSHAQDTVLSKIDVFVVKHSFVTLGIKFDAMSVYSIWKGHSEQGIGKSQFILNNFSGRKFFINRLEIVNQKLVILILIVVKNS